MMQQQQHTSEAYLWIVLWFVLAMLLLLIANSLSVQPLIIASWNVTT